MAEPVTTSKMTPIRACFQLGLTLAATCAMTLARAQNLPDPTRPPDALATARSENAVAPAAGPVLQSVLISPGRRVAIINGQTVKLNDIVGDARVSKITEGSVVLRSGNAIQTLKLFPEIEKRPTPRPARTNNDRSHK